MSAPAPQASPPVETTPAPAWLRLAPLALVAAIVLAWLPAMHAPFTYDDRIEVVGNRTIRWLDSVGAIASYNTSRPLLILTYALNWRLGGLDPFGYHVVSLLIHAANALLAWRLAGRFLTPGRAAFVATAWALHPMTTESVTYITGRSDALEATAWLVGLTAWVDFRRGAPRARWVAFGAVLAGLLTKEVGVTLPVALLAADRWLLPRASVRWRDHLPFWLAGAGAVALRLAMYGWPAPEVPRDAFAQVLSQAEVWARYAALWAWPLGQSILHDHPGVARLQGGLAFAAWCGLAGVALEAAKRADPGSPAAVRAFAFAAWVAWLVPSSAVPLLETMAEHRAYLAGFALIVAFAASFPTPGIRWARAWIAVPLLVGLTVERNRVWADEVTLWADAAAKNPESARAAYGHGEALRLARRFQEAAPVYERAAQLDPADPDPLINLGIVRAETGDPEAAKAAWQRVLAADPKNCSVHNNFGTLAFNAGALDEAAAAYTSTLGWCPDDPIAHLNLANLAWLRADTRAAAFHYRAYLRVEDAGPYAPMARERLARIGVE